MDKKIIHSRLVLLTLFGINILLSTGTASHAGTICNVGDYIARLAEMRWGNLNADYMNNQYKHIGILTFKTPELPNVPQLKGSIYFDIDDYIKTTQEGNDG